MKNLILNQHKVLVFLASKKKMEIWLEKPLKKLLLFNGVNKVR